MGDLVANVFVGWYGVIMLCLAIFAMIGCAGYFASTIGVTAGIPLGVALGAAVAYEVHWIIIVVLAIIAAFGSGWFAFLAKDFQRAASWFN